MTNLYPPAEPGNLFILLAPANQLAADEQVWLDALAERFGGHPLDLIHVSCQRFVCSDPNLLRSLQATLRQRTRQLRPIPITGLELLPLYSPFHEAQLLKCRVQINAGLAQLDQLVAWLLQSYAIQPEFPALSDLVTLLAEIDPLPPEQPIVATELPRQLFLGDQLMVSRINQQRDFEILWQWRLM